MRPSKLSLAALAAASAAALALAPPQARAATETVTYQGIIDAATLEGQDALYFGAVTHGEAVTASYVYDTGLGVVDPIHQDPNTGDPLPVTYDERAGGVGLAASDPILFATFTINGISYTYTPDYYADVSTGASVFDWTNGGFDINGLSQTANAFSGADSQVAFATDAAPSLDLSKAYSSTGFGLGYFNTAFDPANLTDQFDFEASSVTVSPTPEPDVWVLLLTGVALSGLALRRRHGRGLHLGLGASSTSTPG